MILGTICFLDIIDSDIYWGYIDNYFMNFYINIVILNRGPYWKPR